MSSAASSDADRIILNAEFNVLREEIDRIAGATTYNGKNLLTGSNVQVDPAASTALANSSDTGLSRVRLTGAEPGVYTFEDAPGDHYEETNSIGNTIGPMVRRMESAIAHPGAP